MNVFANEADILTWPQLSYVAEDAKGRIVGYVLAKMCAVQPAAPRNRTAKLMCQGGGHHAGASWPHHVARSHAHAPQARPCDEADVASGALDVGHLQRHLYLTPCPQGQPRCLEPL